VNITVNLPLGNIGAFYSVQPAGFFIFWNAVVV
jgi:hypothetical protein